MAGYGNADDHIEAQLNHVEDSLALHRAKLEEQNNTTGYCVDCEDPIPAERLILVPGCLRCFSCQDATEKSENQYNRFQVRTGYMP